MPRFRDSDASATPCLFATLLKLPAFSNYVMNELPVMLARHPRVFDDPERALQETFEQVDMALMDAATEDEHVYR